MDSQRFDNLARAFAARLSRRAAIRHGGAGVAAGLLTAAGLAAPTAAASVLARYSVIRRYKLATGTSFADLTKRLQTGYLPMISQATGFLLYSVVDAGKDAAG